MCVSEIGVVFVSVSWFHFSLIPILIASETFFVYKEYYCSFFFFEGLLYKGKWLKIYAGLLENSFFFFSSTQNKHEILTKTKLEGGGGASYQQIIPHGIDIWNVQEICL